MWLPVCRVSAYPRPRARRSEVHAREVSRKPAHCDEAVPHEMQPDHSWTIGLFLVVAEDGDAQGGLQELGADRPPWKIRHAQRAGHVPALGASSTTMIDSSMSRPRRGCDDRQRQRTPVASTSATIIGAPLSLSSLRSSRRIAGRRAEVAGLYVRQARYCASSLPEVAPGWWRATATEVSDVRRWRTRSWSRRLGRTKTARLFRARRGRRVRRETVYRVAIGLVGWQP